MNLLETFRIAADSLLSHPLRSLLTILGVVIGTASVITLLSVGHNFRDALLREFSGLGADLLEITPGRLFDTTEAADVLPRLSVADGQALLEGKAPAIAAVAAELRVPTTVTSNRRTINATVRGVSATMSAVEPLHPALGRLLTAADETQMARVAVLGWSLANELFRGDDPVGQRITISGVAFDVVGVLQPGSGDFVINIPLGVAQQRLAADQVTRDRDVSALIIRAVSAEAVEQAAAQASAILRERHTLAAGQREGFTVQINRQILDTLSNVITGITYFLALVGSIALLVGGIGIMNIMLVSVTQRTREIGLRRAVGARQRDILLQFLIEAIVLSVTGGMLGMVIGYGATTGIAILAMVLTQSTLISGGLSISAVILATVFSILVGLVFGLYPARHAARLSPMAALRQE